jgi:PST family polysaccharide transporter
MAAVAAAAGGPDGNSQEQPHAESHGDLSTLVRRGVQWSLASVVLGRVLTPISSIIVAHLLVPADFGIYSLAVVVSTALISFNDLGVSQGIVRWGGDVRHAARTATTLAIGSSVVLCGLIVLAAPTFSAAMHAPRATELLQVLSLTVVIDGVSSVPGALLTREFRQARRAGAEWLGFGASTGLTIALAASGFGPWSLVCGRLVGNSLHTISLYLLVDHRPVPGWDRDVARQLMSFGLPLAASSLLLFAMLNADYLIVGRVCGTTALGLYTLAFNISSWPTSIFTGALRPVAVPAFSRLRDDPPQLERSFAGGLRNLGVLTIPMSAGLTVLAVPLVSFFYPDTYLGAASALTFLAVVGGIRVLLDLAYDLLVALGRSRSLLGLQTLWGLVLVPALVIGAHADGIRGVAVGHLVVACAVAVPAYLFALTRIGLHRRPVLQPLARPAAAGVIAAIAAALVVLVVGTGAPGLFGGGVTLLLVYGVSAMPLRDYRRFNVTVLDVGGEPAPDQLAGEPA